MANRYPENHVYLKDWFPDTNDSNYKISEAYDKYRANEVLAQFYHLEYNESYDEDLPMLLYKNSQEQILEDKKDNSSSTNDIEAQYNAKNVSILDKLLPFKRKRELNENRKNLKFILPEPRKEKPKTSLDWNDYYRLDVIHNFLDDLEYDFPSLCTSAIIGHSVEYRELKVLKISNTNTSNTCVWIDGGIHAREWIAPAVNTYIANYIARNFNNLPDCCKNKDWFFLPVLNPDGYEYSHTTERLWRKNRACYAGTCVGVDLNRNFSYGWGGPRSSADPNHVFYRGEEPFSEPESSAMRDFFVNSGLNFQVYITLHSFGQAIVFPFGCQDELAPDYIKLLEGATEMSKGIYDATGSIYKVGTSKDVMRGASGTSNDWCHGVAGIPYCYLLELRSKEHKFKLPKEEIEDTGFEILNGVIRLLAHVDRLLGIPEESKDREDGEINMLDKSE